MIWATKMSTSGNDPFCYLMGNSVKEVNPWKELALWLMGCPRHTLPAIFLGIGESFRGSPKVEQRLLDMSDALQSELENILGDDGVFLYPTHPVPAPYHNQPLTLIFNFAYTGIFNMLGFPVTQVPMGLAKEGVPIGIQLVGSHMNDHLPLAVANAMEKEFGGWIPPFKQ